jgi:hypothetical protein
MAVSSLVAASGGVTPKSVEFTSTGTWTAPSNTTSIDLFLVGGGGGGGGSSVSGNDHAVCGGGGGGGSVIKRTIPVTPGVTYTFTIGGGGSGGTSSAAGAVGSDSTMTGSGFTTITALGGGGAPSGNRSTNTFYQSTSRATSGGAYSVQGGLGGGGGGAGGNAFGFTGGNANTGDLGVYATATGNTYRFPLTPNGGNSGIQSSGGMGGIHMRSSVYAVTQGGVGVDNYGAGGPGSATVTDGFFSVASFAGIVSRTATSCSAQNGVSSIANTGNGGGGSLSWNTGDCGGQSASGGAGGSGYARISYMA